MLLPPPQINVQPTTVAEFTRLPEFFYKTQDQLPDEEEEFMFLRELYELMVKFGMSLDVEGEDLRGAKRRAGNDWCKRS